MAKSVVVVGAGLGGLAAAIVLQTNGALVTVLEQAGTPGGKMREVEVAGRRLDAGPTVLTMPWVFEQLFAETGSSLESAVTLQPAEVLARHAWSPKEQLDLYGDIGRSAEAIQNLAGRGDARRYREFVERARRIYETLAAPFLHSSRPSVLGLASTVGFADLWQIKPFASLWDELGQHFHDPRLRQLFGRYATYCGSSPFLAPATLMLVAHVERSGVWLVKGGMYRLALALADLAVACGVTLRYGTRVQEVVVKDGRASAVRLEGEDLEAAAVVVNADAGAMARGLLGPQAARAIPRDAGTPRSLSAITWNLVAQTDGFPLLRHNVFFSSDYAAEFAAVFRGRRVPQEPTVYVCAQDRDATEGAGPRGSERLLCLVNAPPIGDTHQFSPKEVASCEERMLTTLERGGLRIRQGPGQDVVTTPEDFERLFPGTGGALYGAASHGWRATFRRPGSRTRISGLYLAGGSTHPGPGVPLAALSGRLAAEAILADWSSTSRSRPAATSGGTSTH